MKPEDFKNAPKVFCESINVAYTPEFFVMSLTSGVQANIFALTPQHTKRLAQYLAHQVAEFEKTNGEVKSDWNPNIISPLQPQKPESTT